MLIDEKNILRILEALIFASDKAIHFNEIKKRIPECKNLKEYLLKLKDSYKEYCKKAYSYNELPNHFFDIINKEGKSNRTPNIANIIAIDVNIPNITVGIKFDKLNIEKPRAIVIEVVKTANPALELVKLIESIIVLVL